MKMTKEIPALGVTKIWEYDTATAFDVSCACGSDEHRFQMIVDIDEHDEIVVTSYITMTTDYWSEFIKKPLYNIDNSFVYTVLSSVKSLVNSLATRLKLTYNVWGKGHITYESTVIMSKQHALNYASAIIDSINKLETK
jgi:hypothetical protein